MTAVDVGGKAVTLDHKDGRVALPFGGRRTAAVFKGLTPAQVGERLGKTILELGGNNAMIVTESAELDLALAEDIGGGDASTAVTVPPLASTRVWACTTWAPATWLGTPNMPSWTETLAAMGIG